MGRRSTLTSVVAAEQHVKKSRFLAQASHIDSPEAAREFIESYSDASANHNCWAWRIGQIYRFSDDGEPSGTAGKPILAVIDGQALDQVVVVVTRWFGGVLLGSGGLVRAYGGTAGLCLRGAETTPLLDLVQARVACPFSDLALMQARLSACDGVQTLPPTFDANGAVLSLAIPRDAVEQVAALVSDLTSGRVHLHVGGD